jgi:hypothetical protein
MRSRQRAYTTNGREFGNAPGVTAALRAALPDSAPFPLKSRQPSVREQYSHLAVHPSISARSVHASRFPKIFFTRGLTYR